MQAIVTGANGFLGHHFVEELSRQHYTIHAIVKDKNEKIENIADIPGIKIYHCDLNDLEKLHEIIRDDMEDAVFYHFAWAGSSGEARKNYELQLWNAKCSVKAAEVAAKLKCKKIVFTGSVTQLMYEDYLHQDGATPESTVCYAVGKIAAEEMVRCVCPDIGIEWNWTYIANFYGADDPTDNFVNMLIRNYSAGIVPELTPATQLADFMYVSDVARAILAVGERGRANTSYYVGQGSPKPLYEYINTIKDCINPKLESGIGRKPFNGLNIDFDKIDYLKLSRDTGFKPVVSFEDGIKKVLSEKWKAEKVK